MTPESTLTAALAEFGLRHEPHRNGPYVTALTSIAISLKRIADQLNGSSSADRDNTSVADVLNSLPYFLNRWGGPNQ